MSHGDLPHNILEGLDRLVAVMRADEWATAEARELTATQVAILSYLGRRGASRLQDVAAHLGVSAPTASASVDALVRKALVARRKDARDARALALELTKKGRQDLRDLAQRPSRLRTAIATLPAGEQANLFLAVIKLIRTLQTAGAMPVQRVCVTCKHFRPFAHRDAEAPHHCALVNAPFGTRDLRLDCGEHDEADPAVQTAIWTAFDKVSQPSRQTTTTEKDDG